MKKIYIHIGNFKTASTSIQNFIFLNRNLFNKNNVQVLIEKHFNVTTNNMLLFKYINQKNKKKVKSYFSNIEKNKNLLLTCEYFSTFSDDINKLIYFKKIMHELGFKPIIIFYYRFDNSYLYSFYSELLTHRKTIKIDNVFNFINKIKHNGYYNNIKNKKYYLSQKYFFNNRLIKNNWEKVFKNNFHYLRFEKNRGESIFFNFLKIVGIKKISNFKIPSQSNKTRKIKIWNLKKIFYFLYLTYKQKSLFKKKDLDIN